MAGEKFHQFLKPSHNAMHSETTTIRKPSTKEKKTELGNFIPGSQFTIKTHSASDSSVCTANFKKIERITLVIGNMKHHVDKLTLNDDSVTYVIPYHGDGGTTNEKRFAEHLELRKLVEAIHKMDPTATIVIAGDANINPIIMNANGTTYPNEEYVDFLMRVSPDEGREGVTDFEMPLVIVDKTRGLLDKNNRPRGLSALCAQATKTGKPINDLKSFVLRFEFNNKGRVSNALNPERIREKIRNAIPKLKRKDFRKDNSLFGADHEKASMKTRKNVEIISAPKISTRNVKGFYLPSDIWKQDALDSKTGDPTNPTTWDLSEETHTLTLDSAKEFGELSVQLLQPLVQKRLTELDHQICLAAQMLYKATEGNKVLKHAVLRNLKWQAEGKEEGAKDEAWRIFYHALVERIQNEKKLTEFFDNLADFLKDNNLQFTKHPSELYQNAKEAENDLLKQFLIHKDTYPQAEFAEAYTKVRDILKETEDGGSKFKNAAAKAVNIWSNKTTGSKYLNLLLNPQFEVGNDGCKTIAENMFKAKCPLDAFFKIGGQTTAGFMTEVSGYRPVFNELMWVLQALGTAKDLKKFAANAPVYMVNLEGGLFAPQCHLLELKTDSTSSDIENMCPENSHMLVLVPGRIHYVNKLSKEPFQKIRHTGCLSSENQVNFEKIAKRIQGTRKFLENSQDDDSIADAVLELMGINLKGSQPQEYFDYVNRFLSYSDEYNKALKEPLKYAIEEKRKKLSGSLEVKAEAPVIDPRLQNPNLGISLFSNTPVGHLVPTSVQELKESKPKSVQTETRRLNEYPHPLSLRSTYNLGSDEPEAQFSRRKLFEVYNGNQLNSLNNSDKIRIELVAFLNACQKIKNPTKQQATDILDLQWSMYDLVMCPEHQNVDPCSVNDILKRLGSRSNSSCLTKIALGLFALVIVAALLVATYAFLTGDIALIRPVLDTFGSGGSSTALLAETTAATMTAFGGGAATLAVTGSLSAAVATAGIAAYIKYNLFRPKTFVLCEKAENIRQALDTSPCLNRQ